MTLVIKTIGATAPAGAGRLFRDALVNEGTMFLVDFSNRGTLDNFDISRFAPVYNLAREAAIEEGVSVTGVSEFNGPTAPGGHTLTAGRGLELYEEGVSGLKRCSLFEGNIWNHFSSNQPRSLAIMWVRRAETIRGSGTSVLQAYEGTAEVNNLRSVKVGIGSGGATLSFGGSGIAGSSVRNDSNLHQLAVEFIGVGIPNRTYIDGEYIGEASSAAVGFQPADGFGIGRVLTTAYDAAVYRLMIEDLSASGRTALDVVRKDWDYVHARGEFEGIPQRPFVNNY